MNDQNYNNHIRYYIPHHFLFYPAILILTGISLWYAFNYPERSPEFCLTGVLFLMMGWLSFMLRQHYSLGNQNRVIRLEMRLRYFQLTGETFEPIEEKLTFGQLAALRFASNEQLLTLIQQAIDKNLSPDNIKKTVQNWEPDHMRV